MQHNPPRCASLNNPWTVDKFWQTSVQFVEIVNISGRNMLLNQPSIQQIQYQPPTPTQQSTVCLTATTTYSMQRYWECIIIILPCNLWLFGFFFFCLPFWDYFDYSVCNGWSKKNTNLKPNFTHFKTFNILCWCFWLSHKYHTAFH